VFKNLGIKMMRSDITSTTTSREKRRRSEDKQGRRRQTNDYTDHPTVTACLLLRENVKDENYYSPGTLSTSCLQFTTVVCGHVNAHYSHLYT